MEDIRHVVKQGSLELYLPTKNKGNLDGKREKITLNLDQYLQQQQFPFQIKHTLSGR